MGVSHILKDRRKELNYTLLDIAKKVGVSEATVQRWESGNIKNLRYEKIIALADILEMSPSHLMGWDDNVGESFSCENPPIILHLMEQLNDEGQEKVVEYAEGLIALGKYKKHGQSELDQKEA